jgi:hypothetical protein
LLSQILFRKALHVGIIEVHRRKGDADPISPTQSWIALSTTRIEINLTGLPSMLPS